MHFTPLRRLLLACVPALLFGLASAAASAQTLKLRILETTDLHMNLIGWEFFFRSFIGIGMRDRFGTAGATFIQVILTTARHLGKPEGETWSTIFAGIFLGLLTYRTRSFWYAVLFHFYMGMANTAFAGL